VRKQIHEVVRFTLQVQEQQVQNSRLANDIANSRQPKMLKMTMHMCIFGNIKLTVVFLQGSGDRLTCEKGTLQCAAPAALTCPRLLDRHAHWLASNKTRYEVYLLASQSSGVFQARLQSFGNSAAQACCGRTVLQLSLLLAKQDRKLMLAGV